MWDEPTAHTWPQALQSFVSPDQTSVRLRAARANFYVWFLGPMGLLVLVLGIVGIVSERSLATFTALFFVVILVVLWVGGAAYVLFGHQDIKHCEGGWRVETVLGPFRSVRSFSQRAVRVACFKSGWAMVATADTAGPHFELEFDGARPLRIGAGFCLDEAVLAALAAAFGVDLINESDRT